MLFLGFLLAVSLVTILAVLMSCELQARAEQASRRLLTIPVDEREQFERLVAPLRRDPEFGRIDS